MKVKGAVPNGKVVFYDFLQDSAEVAAQVVIRRTYPGAITGGVRGGQGLNMKVNICIAVRVLVVIVGLVYINCHNILTGC